MMTTDVPYLRIGIDLGGTKIAGVLLAGDDTVIADARIPTPRDDYDRTIRAIAEVVARLAQHDEAGGEKSSAVPVGVGMPGSISARTGRVQNANSTWLNGRNFVDDLGAALNRPVRTANDANCLLVSELQDGAAKGAQSAFGVILGTGCGGAIAIDGRVADGALGIRGEWGHTPLPAPRLDEIPGPFCWCGRRGCLETWISGPAIAADYVRRAGVDDAELKTSEEIIAAARRFRRAENAVTTGEDLHGDVRSDQLAAAVFDDFLDRLARGLSVVVNLVDPDVIVVGGGLSEVTEIYDALPARMAAHVFSDTPHAVIKPARHGAASGVRGAARLWPLGPASPTNRAAQSQADWS
ncbi:MAG: ROK family protein [Pseudomonadota bacterium]